MFPGPPPADARNAGRQITPKEDPAPTDHRRPLLGAALYVDPTTVVAKSIPARPTNGP